MRSYSKKFVHLIRPSDRPPEFDGTNEMSNTPNMIAPTSFLNIVLESRYDVVCVFVCCVGTRWTVEYTFIQ